MGAGAPPHSPQAGTWAPGRGMPVSRRYMLSMPIWMVSSSFWLLVMLAWASWSLSSSSLSMSFIFSWMDLKLLRTMGRKVAQS